MTIIIEIIAFSIIFTSVKSLEPLHDNGDILNKIISLLSNKQATQRRAVNPESPDEPNAMYRQLTKDINKIRIKQMLRSEDGNNQIYAADKQAEEELKSSLVNKKSALMDRPHLETKGKSDFLVFGPSIYDPFVTVLPNAMYQSVEKKCVNWLDDCSLKGIRARLLRGVQSPYR